MNLSSRLSFFRVVQISCALSFGLFAAFVCSIVQITPGFRLAFSAGTVVGFFLGALAGWHFWKMAWNAQSGAADRRLKWKFIGWGILLASFTMGSFAYGLRGLSREKLWDFAIGTGTAVIFLTIVGSFLFFFARQFDRDGSK